MAVDIDRDSLRTKQGPGPVTGLAKGADEVAVGVENLDPIVEGR